ncbi:hypothetical protein [Cesiribacter sp. SM1]|uniref:hypothetical protein n=1 Tax=Cesiribacter sp. SM1 TaxID=2861196 RepID=UPI001CD5A220|nr:hypothetical protein [Cesiribacter sp. SM1]
MRSVRLFYFFLVLAGSLCCTPGAFAQDLNHKNELQLQWGLRQYMRQDFLFSPMLYQGNSLLNARLNYRRQRNSSIHLFGISAGQYNMGSGPLYRYLEWRTLEEVDAIPTTFVLLDLHYAFLKTIHKGNKLTLSAGGILENGTGAFFWGYGAQSFFGYTLTTGIGPVLQARYALGAKHALEGSFSMPVLSWLARSPYAVNDDEFIANQSSHSTLTTLGNLYKDGSLVTIDKLQKLNWMLSYSLSLSERWSAAAVYQGEYFRFSAPRKVVAIRNELSLGITYHF